MQFIPVYFLNRVHSFSTIAVWFMLYIVSVNQIEILHAVVSGLMIALYMAISVGPTLFAVIKYSMDNSHKAAFAFVFGVSLSDIIYVTIANLAANWLTELNKYSKYIALGGGILLIIVGAVGIFSKVPIKTDDDRVLTIRGAQYFRIFISGFLINSINPGVIISWLTAVSACAGTSSGYRFILFTVCLSVILGIDLLKILLANRLRKLLTPERMTQVKKASSVIILLLGVVLLVHYFM